MEAEASGGLLGDLAELVNCAVCLESFKDPRSLPCQHSFCLDCLQGVLGQGQVLYCPLCKHIVYVSNGVWELPKDFRANTCLEKLANYQKALDIAATRAREEETKEDRNQISACDTATLLTSYNDPSTSSPRIQPEDKLTFDPRCGGNVVVHANQITAHRSNVYSSSKPSIILTSRLLEPNEIFEVRLEKKVKIYEGSIIIGVTVHSGRHLDFPPNISNIRSGTWILSGEQVLKNGTITNSQYSQDLDMLEVGSCVGVQRRDDGTLHFYINGVDQGVAATGVPTAVYGAIDLFGNAQQATIVDSSGDKPDEGQLTFHPRCGAEAIVHANQITAQRNNPLRTFSDGVVLTSRHLKVNERFEIRLDKKVKKWAGSITIGVTTRSPVELEFPSCVVDIRPGTLMLSRRVVKWNGLPIMEQYGKDLDTLKEGDLLGVQRRKKGSIHFYINGVDQGVTATNIPAAVYGAIDLHGDAVQATIMDTSGLLDDSSEHGHEDFYIDNGDQGGAIDIYGDAVQATTLDTSGLLDDSNEHGHRCCSIS